MGKIRLYGKLLILGSASLARKQVLNEAGIECECISADIDEKKIPGREDFKGPSGLALFIAEAKRLALMEKLKGRRKCFLVTADQIVLHAKEIREKPQDEKQLAEWLRSYSVSVAPIDYLNGMTVTNLDTSETARDGNQAHVNLRPIPEKVQAKILKCRDFYGMSGGIGIEHALIRPYVRSIHGGMDGVMGMPLSLLQKLIDAVK